MRVEVSSKRRSFSRRERDDEDFIEEDENNTPPVYANVLKKAKNHPFSE
jgi:hypothetical protein